MEGLVTSYNAISEFIIENSLYLAIGFGVILLGFISYLARKQLKQIGNWLKKTIQNLVILAKEIKRKIKKRKIKKAKINLVKKRIKRVKVSQERIKKMKIPKKKIKLPKVKIKPALIKFSKWVSKYKIPVIIVFLIFISGLLIYYFKIYEIVAGWFIALAQWISSIPWNNILPYIYYGVGALIGLAILIILVISFKKKIKKIKIPKRKVNKIKSMFIKLGRWIIK
ncbi:unnamed protein product, partial [marine sediment metagenome]